MDSQQRKLIILIVLLGAWGLIFVFRSPWGSPARPEPRGAVATAARTPVAQGGGLPRLKQELLHLPPPAYPPEVQTLFGTPAPAAPPPRPIQVTVTAPAPPPDLFQEEAKRLRYVGFLQAPGRTTAFIVHGTEVYTVEAGATIAGRFRIQAVTEEAVVLSSIPGGNQVRLPLTAEAAPAPKR